MQQSEKYMLMILSFSLMYTLSVNGKTKYKKHLNEGKFELIPFGKKIILKPPYYLLTWVNLKMPNNSRHLIVIVDINLNLSNHITKKVNITRRVNPWILRIFRSRKQGVSIQLFLSFLRPNLKYCLPLLSL